MTQKVKIYRHVVISGTNEAYSLLYSDIDINLQGMPTGNFSTLVKEGKTYKLYKGYIEGVYDIQEDDEIEDISGNRYYVSGTAIYNTEYTNNVQLELLKFIK